MARKKKLFELKPKIKNNLRVIFIYINEAHSSKWPIGRDYQPEPQKSIQERIDRAKEFKKLHDWPYEIFVDTWENKFEELFHAWPDKYYLLDRDLKIVAKSTYGTEAHNDGVVEVDSTEIIENFIE